MRPKKRLVSLGIAAVAIVWAINPSSSFAYVLEGPRWGSGSTVVFELGLGAAPRVLIDGNTSWNTAALPAFGMWNQRIQRAQTTWRNPTTGASSGDGINSIVFSSTVFGQSFGPHTLAVTYYRYSGSTMSEADILFNQNQQFDSYRGALRYGSNGYAIGDIRRVLVHELGHALGLDHPDDAGQNVDAIMNSIISNRETLANDDISGGQVLYGAPGPTPTPTATPPPGLPTSTSILLQNRFTGQRQMWGMNGTNHVSTYNLGVLTTQWNIVARGDFDGRGDLDIVWENSLGGQHAVWFMYGANRAGLWSLGTVGPVWKVATAGDFNGDGKADVVWQNNVTGQRSIWIMNGTTYVRSINLGAVPTSWKIVGSGDFNGDGMRDILWQNNVTGQRSVWFMNYTNHTSTTVLATLATSWNIVGTGDFNHDNKPDILLQNETTGQRVIWLMNRTATIQSVSLGTVSLDWDIRNY